MLPDGEKIIVRIRAFLKKAYPAQKKPISTALSANYKSLEYRFLGTFQPTQYNISKSDIDQYFDTPTISTGFDPNQSQTEFIRNWWKANKLKFPCMAKVAQDHLTIPAAEVDIERLFNGGRDILGIRRFSMNVRKFVRSGIIINSSAAHTEHLRRLGTTAVLDLQAAPNDFASAIGDDAALDSILDTISANVTKQLSVDIVKAIKLTKAGTTRIITVKIKELDFEAFDADNEPKANFTTILGTGNLPSLRYMSEPFAKPLGGNEDYIARSLFEPNRPVVLLEG
ncbi:conserved hypothetical protein [Talaromyces stipitatus ATCC 10500]|uniref:HAT C-terminal dimerisation domain-containing protein n=1 Tax=Talaromyces stipitatus (strain ATCC 10500 / CBS 375.48 / QM 6759 / NRRL 1006) TaxID=441959 RepID=B8LZT1_TALSN|nr:uncharacterized protein TSTA_080960 [Talaromyces stipitatus ATCC 10500]EED20863.1 conserved hypothetical protein [Talaromyces stipitatus ATCC 10500]